ncbi:hypothetical protein TanjilG_19738 [Lupinus angustifolius]|uniref:Uncharacterized protein n=1 Tax=Lupinus angustifolius TaxID=3871 RepID=A0A394DC30_LUPAN|nr:hypothetical protein TanjilG_19738 [Lupinus angustifolius]
MGEGNASHPDADMDIVQRRLMFDDECILVDQNDRVVGHDSKYNCHLMENIEAKNLLHRAFSVFLFNSKYELLLQQRSATKAPSDGKWGEHELDYLLFIVRDVNVTPNPDEVADVKYVNRDQLKELLEKADAGDEGLKLSPWFRLVVDNFLFKWWDHVEKGTLEKVADMKTIHRENDKKEMAPPSSVLVATEKTNNDFTLLQVHDSDSQMFLDTKQISANPKQFRWFLLLKLHKVLTCLSWLTSRFKATFSLVKKIISSSDTTEEGLPNGPM